MAQPQPNLDWYAEKGDDLDRDETEEWLEALDDVIAAHGPERAHFLLEKLARARLRARRPPPLHRQHALHQHHPAAASSRPIPGNREIERRIKSLVRWNAMAMVVRANQRGRRHRRPHLDLRLGGDALRGRLQPLLPRPRTTSIGGDHRLLPGPRLARHLRPRVPRRAARPSSSSRTSAASSQPGGGLSSYPHPWLMPDFWEFPTVSMGLGPIMAIYQARFNRYLEDRGLKPTLATARSGPSSATARPTSPSRSARSRWPRARSSTT